MRKVLDIDFCVNVQQVMRKMLYISLGEVGTLDEDMATEIQMIVYIIWVILTNVSVGIFLLFLALLHPIHWTSEQRCGP